MDNGEVIVGLNESWTLAGAKLSEWAAGFMMFIIAQELFFNNIARSMPFLMAIWIGSTFSFAALRKSFPDEERGLANYVMAVLGFCPPNVPAPAIIQPYWSGCRMTEVPKNKDFSILGLEEVFAEIEEEISDGKEN